MNSEEDLLFRLSKQRVPLLAERHKLQNTIRLLRKDLYNVSRELTKIDQEILQLSAKLII